MLTWPTLRDIAIAGTGLATVWSQLLLWDLSGRTPSDVLLAVGLALLAPAASAHVRTVLGSGEAGSSSSSSPPPPEPSSPRSQLPEGGTSGE